jgi:cytosine/adenosine deaminase-related metal-dependent hydrolase
VATTASADQFTQMHAILGSERGRKHQEAWDANLDGLEASPGLISVRDVLRWATLGGAEVAGLADRTGSITPGKRADLVIIDTKAVNVAPVIDPVGAVVCAADISNVRTVFVDGQVVKDDFRLVASLDGPRRAVEESRDYLVGKFGEPEPGWMVGRPSATAST